MNYKAALALITTLAVPAKAFAVVWHCVAHPIGLPADQHHGFGFSVGEAEANALAFCESGHGPGTCVVAFGLCHIDH